MSSGEIKVESFLGFSKGQNVVCNHDGLKGTIIGFYGDIENDKCVLYLRMERKSEAPGRMILSADVEKENVIKNKNENSNRVTIRIDRPKAFAIKSKEVFREESGSKEADKGKEKIKIKIGNSNRRNDSKCSSEERVQDTRRVGRTPKIRLVFAGRDSK